MGLGARDTKMSKTKTVFLEWVRQTHKQIMPTQCGKGRTMVVTGYYGNRGEGHANQIRVQARLPGRDDI